MRSTTLEHLSINTSLPFYLEYRDDLADTPTKRVGLASQEVEIEWTVLLRATKTGKNQSPWQVSRVELRHPQNVTRPRAEAVHKQKSSPALDGAQVKQKRWDWLVQVEEDREELGRGCKTGWKVMRFSLQQ